MHELCARYFIVCKVALRKFFRVYMQCLLWRLPYEDLGSLMCIVMSASVASLVLLCFCQKICVRGIIYVVC